MAIKTADDLFLNSLKDIYSAEKQAVRAYPKLAKAVESEELKEALQTHLQETKGQIERLDRVFEILGKRPSGKTCEAMKGLLEEAMEVVEEIAEAGPLRDAGLIAAAQKMEHYEIASYGTVATLAQAMGQEEIAQLLGQTLQEEKQTDEKLTGVSNTVNQQALGELEEEEDEDEEQDEDDEEEDDSEEDEEPKSAAKKAPAKKSAAKKSSSTK